SGDAVSALDVPSAETADHWYFLNGVEVAGPHSSAAVVILGDSITDGKNSTTNANGRWPDELARRLEASKHRPSIGVLNEGIGGNRLLHDGLGPNALSRLDRDVLTQTGVRWLVVLEGVNDIGTCKSACDLDSTARDIINAYRQIIIRAHSQNMRVYGATITPFGGSFYGSEETERARQALNHWRRTSGWFEREIDLDAATRAVLQRRITQRLDPGVARGNGTTVVPAGSNSYRAFLLILLASTLPPSGICSYTYHPLIRDV